MSPRNWLLGCALVGLLAACASLGLEQPKTWTQRIAYSNATLTAVYTAIGNCVSVRTCTKPQGQNLIDQADTVRAALDAAGGVGNSGVVIECLGKNRTALECLQAAQTVLTGLQVYLEGRK